MSLLYISGYMKASLKFVFKNMNIDLNQNENHFAKEEKPEEVHVSQKKKELQ